MGKLVDWLSKIASALSESSSDTFHNKLDLNAFTEVKLAEIEARLNNRLTDQLTSSFRFWGSTTIAVISVLIGILGIIGYKKLEAITQSVPSRIEARVNTEFETPRIQAVVKDVAANYTRAFSERLAQQAIAEKISPLSNKLDEFHAKEEKMNSRLQELDGLIAVEQLRVNARLAYDAFARLRRISESSGPLQKIATTTLNELVRDFRPLSQIPDQYSGVYILNPIRGKLDVKNLTVDEQFHLLGNPSSSIVEISNVMAIIKASHTASEIVPAAIHTLKTHPNTSARLAAGGILRSLFMDKFGTTDFDRPDAWIQLYEAGKLQ